MAIDEVAVRVSDLDDVRGVLGAAYNYFLAADIQSAQMDYRAQRPSPLTSEIARVKERFDGYFSDFLFAEHEAQRAEEEDQGDQVEDTELEAEDGSGEPTEVLSDQPLGDFEAPKQKGRRLKVGELGS